MIKEKQNNNTNNLFYSQLLHLIDNNHEIVKLASIIKWEDFDVAFEKYYRKDFGRPAKPIRLMVSLLILKQLYNLSDEEIVARWVENPYWQYFSGEEYFQINFPCDPTELTKFRNRIGVAGVEKIFEISIKIHGKDAEEKEVIPDTTVQEKNITFPTDSKLHLKIINRCRKIAKENNIDLRQSYVRVLKQLRWSLRYLNNPKRKKEAKKAMRSIKTIAGRLLREIIRKLPQSVQDQYEKLIMIMTQILNQKRGDKNKIYSLHEPTVACIAKGKEHKKYEFGSKVSILITKTTGIIVGALNFQGNPYDGNTLEPALEQSKRLRGFPAEKAITDEGYRGRSQINETELIRAHQKNKGKYSKYKWRNWFKRRASVEAVISHLKNDYRLDRNYLKGSEGDSINLLLSAAAYNIRKFLQKLSFIFQFLNLKISIILKSIFEKMIFLSKVNSDIWLFQG